jgi:hypothetical protein
MEEFCFKDSRWPPHSIDPRHDPIANFQLNLMYTTAQIIKHDWFFFTKKKPAKSRSCIYGETSPLWSQYFWQSCHEETIAYKISATFATDEKTSTLDNSATGRSSLDRWIQIRDLWIQKAFIGRLSLISEVISDAVRR